jgi:hypothetical protein
MHYNVSFSQTIQAKADKVKMNKIQALNTGPVIIGIRDSVSGLTDGTLTAGGVLDIYGTRLKVFAESADNGVYFVAAGGTEYKAVTLVENKPSRLIVMLPSGTYVLEVRTHYINSNKPGKQLRKIQFSKPLILSSGGFPPSLDIFVDTVVKPKATHRRQKQSYLH